MQLVCDQCRCFNAIVMPQDSCRRKKGVAGAASPAIRSVLRRPLFWAGRAPLTLRDCLFCAVSGLRGSISLILAQAVVTEVPAAVNSTALVRVPCWSEVLPTSSNDLAASHSCGTTLEQPRASCRCSACQAPFVGPACRSWTCVRCLLSRHCRNKFTHVPLQKVQSEVVLFTAVFVLLTLLVNAPMLPVVLRMTKCAGFPPLLRMVSRFRLCPAACLSRYSFYCASQDCTRNGGSVDLPDVPVLETIGSDPPAASRQPLQTSHENAMVSQVSDLRLTSCTQHSRLDAVPVQHQKMRRKALRLLLRHTDEAVDELRDDNDEMLRGGCT